MKFSQLLIDGGKMSQFTLQMWSSDRIGQVMEPSLPTVCVCVYCSAMLL